MSCVQRFVNLPSNENRNIINQCILGSHQMDGTWATNGQLYKLSSEWN